MKLDLTICIPTYNRPDLLSECIDSVVASINYSSSDVKIIISDNCSDVSYQHVINNKLKIFKNIKYYRNKTNVTDLNFYLCVERAKTKYIWIFSDDDLMEINAIKKLEESLDLKDNLVVCNYSLYDFHITKCLQRNLIDLNFSNSYTDYNKVMEDFGFRLSFISCIIFKRNEFLMLPKDTYLSYTEHQFPFLLTIYFMLLNNCNLRFIKNDIVVQRAFKNHGEQDWWYRIFVVGSNKVFHYLKNIGYAKLSIRKAKNKIIQNYIIPDVIYRRLNELDFRNKSILLIKNYYNYPISVFVLLLISNIPIFLLRLIYKFYKNCQKK